jgi:ribosome maturation factor RimP
VPVDVRSQGLADAIEGVAAPVVLAHGLTLVDVDVRQGGRRTVVRFYVDKPGGVTIDDCRRFSEEVGDALEVADLVPGHWDLEVSSPGLDRELRKDRELRWAVGRPVRVWVREPVADRRELTGTLGDVDDVAVTLVGGPEPVRIPRSLIAKMRLDLERPGRA